VRDEGYQNQRSYNKTKDQKSCLQNPQGADADGHTGEQGKIPDHRNARDNDMGEQSPSEYASGKVTSAEEWAARKTGRTVTRAGKTAAQTSYEKIKQRAAGKKEAEKEAEKETARGTGDTQTADPASRETPEQKSREVQIQKIPDK
jgi:hypothetical protein